MLFERLHRLGSRAERLLMYPSRFEVSGNKTDGQSWESALLRKARDEYNVILKPIEVLQRNGQDGTWAESYTKLLAFNQTQYARVLQLDSDSTLLQLLLIQPSNFEFARISKAIDAAGSKEYDMEIMNKLYKDSALILPHRPYTMLTTEYRYKDHTDYMGNEEEPFDPERVLKECKFLHFSDWPMPKVKASDQLLRTEVLTYS
ncbi:MAG: hypothetical protein LQ349_006902 [Xanthoria aureola]|nr:MAG: hypothetical protein LQ349_006902 [Xanthoria aureola]